MGVLKQAVQEDTERQVHSYRLLKKNLKIVDKGIWCLRVIHQQFNGCTGSIDVWVLSYVLESIDLSSIQKRTRLMNLTWNAELSL